MKFCLVMGKYFFMNMLLSSVVTVFATSLLLNDAQITGAHAAQSKELQQKFISLNGCRYTGLQSDCCVGVDIPNSPPRDVCLNVKIIPNEVTLKATLSIDGKEIYSGQLDPSAAPICPPVLSGICLAINHVDIEKRQICTKLSLFVFTLVKFPCVSQQNGQLVIEPNMYN